MLPILSKMRFLSIFVVFTVFYSVSCKNNVKALTESMGQEVIEIGTPVKELPPELEEEPSAEADDDDKQTASIAATIIPVTKKEAKKVETRRKPKDMDVNDEDDARIEKELSEIYKDNAEYKDSSDDPKTQKNATDKPVLRAGSNFKFQPDLNNKKEVERFRTSIDDISCAKSVTRLDDRDRPQGTDTKKPADSGSASIIVTSVFWILSFLLAYNFC